VVDVVPTEHEQPDPTEAVAPGRFTRESLAALLDVYRRLETQDGPSHITGHFAAQNASEPGGPA
jgi:hypothetical protein